MGLKLAVLPADRSFHGRAREYLTLRSEDHALLLGSLLLFGALAGAMIVTRRFDWYAVGGHLPGAPDTETGPPTPAGRDA